jgi:hypothetical protein
MAEQTEQQREAKAVALANATQAAALALADQTAFKAVGLANDRQAAALVLAEEKGRKDAKLEARIDGHDQHFALVNGSIERTAKGLTSLGKSVADLAKAFEMSTAVAADRAGRQLSTRTFVFGLIGAATAVIIAVSYLHL